MVYLVTVLIIVISVLLVILILAQNPKGNGLSSQFGGSASQYMGAKGTSDFLEKGSWYLAFALFAIIVMFNMGFSARETTATKSANQIAAEKKSTVGEGTDASQAVDTTSSVGGATESTETTSGQ